ncbi:pentapeptide repeat-containing protein [Baaleninema simplex]|uniref:pentapeptide repeat-containing protein n=1 Tax=Baaleninema simplex TaxID=2862350 RepID=UPI00036D3148|nr:pentapeptide repeat-containing protein [Baaleninema simplex]
MLLFKGKHFCLLHNWDAPDRRIKKIDLSGVNLSGAIFRDAVRSGIGTPRYRLNLRNANLSNTDLRNVDFYEANLEGADLSGADLRGANLASSKTTGANLSRANLTDASISDARLDEVDLREANLTRVYAGGCDFSGADMTDAILIEADLNEAPFMGTNLTRVNLRGAKFGYYYYEEDENYQEIGEELFEPQVPLMREANLTEVDFSVTDLAAVTDVTNISSVCDRKWQNAVFCNTVMPDGTVRN